MCHYVAPCWRLCSPRHGLPCTIKERHEPLSGGGWDECIDCGHEWILTKGSKTHLKNRGILMVQMMEAAAPASTPITPGARSRILCQGSWGPTTTTEASVCSWNKTPSQERSGCVQQQYQQQQQQQRCGGPAWWYIIKGSVLARLKASQWIDENR